MAEIAEEVIEFKGIEDNRLVATVFSSGAEESNPPALFMHGGGQTRYSWEGAAKQLCSLGVTCITVDARGHGESDWVESKNYSFYEYRDDMILLVSQIRERFGRAPILIGASMGGISGMLASEKAGADQFSAMVFVDITPRMEASGVAKIQGFMAEKMKEGFASAQEAADAIAAYLPNRKRPRSLDGLRKNLRKGEDGRLYWHWDPAFLRGPRTIDTLRDEGEERLPDACRSISVPTLLVRGANSELVTEEAAAEFLELVPHSKFVDVSDAGHMVAGDRNDIFAAAVIDFLKAEVLA